MTHDTAVERLEGISGVPVTPFTSDLQIDDAALGEVVSRMAHQGVPVIVPNGGTGEFSALMPAERARAARITIEAAADALVLVGVGGDAAGAADAARDAIGAGAGGVLVHALTDPYLTPAGVIAYIERIAAACDGVVVPYVRGRLPDWSTLERIAEIENVVAVKWAIADVQLFSDFVDRLGSAVVPICGLAEMWAPFFTLAGGRGFTSGLVNVDAALSLRMLEALRAGDWESVMGAWRLIKPFEEIRARHDAGNNVPAVKEAMELAGVLPCSAVRPPLAPLSPDDRRDLETAVGLISTS